MSLQKTDIRVCDFCKKSIIDCEWSVVRNQDFHYTCLEKIKETLPFIKNNLLNIHLYEEEIITKSKYYTGVVY